MLQDTEGSRGPSDSGSQAGLGLAFSLISLSGIDKPCVKRRADGATTKILRDFRISMLQIDNRLRPMKPSGPEERYGKNNT